MMTRGSEKLKTKSEKLKVENNFEPALYIVATPIGNLQDITFRAVEILKSVDLILAEDTRHSRNLLQKWEISTPMDSYNDFNKERKTPAYIKKLTDGLSLALISDAGTPGVADPAFYLVREARRKGLPVISLPGPSAFVSALVCSGLPTDHFLFANFPPKKSASRLKQLEEYKTGFQSGFSHVPTIIYYIGPKQLTKFLGEIQQVFGADLRVVLARELTKKFEQLLDATAAEHLEYYRERNPRGEYVLMFHPHNKG